ncbi:tll0795 [Thermosynechococcus vestitus BP-1]|uniref:Tll0795 protein n=2 Tax=Thermosynechococcus vestitus TaxID=146786 RepID=Q8DKR2_THEVB|nr:tll0795 [Thermosynechococcus vestitus BP-1]
MPRLFQVDWCHLPSDNKVSTASGRLGAVSSTTCSDNDRLGGFEMNLLKKLFGALFGLFGAIAKLFGLGKKGEFYIELDESKAAPAAPPTTTKAAEAAPTAEAAPAPQPAQPVAAAPVEPTPTPVTPSVPYTRFARRRPGANMAAFLNMARQVRPST